MLAEIFMLHLEAKLRVLPETTPSRSRQLVAFGMSSKIKHLRDRAGPRIPTEGLRGEDLKAT